MRIIYIDVDTLRADHTTPYGYHRPTTPNLQRLADKSVTFDRYYCSDSPCLPSRTALTSGQFGISNGVIGHFGPAAQFRLDAGHGPEPDRPLLGQRLGWGGYYTAAISVFAERHRAYFFHGNFRESTRATDRFGDEEAPDVNRAAIDWLRRHADEDDWYLHLTYWDPHTNYTQPAEWTERMAASGPVQAWPDEETIAAHAEFYGPRSALDLHYSLMGAGTSPVPHNMPDAIRSRADFGGWWRPPTSSPRTGTRASPTWRCPAPGAAEATGPDRTDQCSRGSPPWRSPCRSGPSRTGRRPGRLDHHPGPQPDRGWVQRDRPAGLGCRPGGRLTARGDVRWAAT